MQSPQVYHRHSSWFVFVCGGFFGWFLFVWGLFCWLVGFGWLGFGLLCFYGFFCLFCFCFVWDFQWFCCCYFRSSFSSQVEHYMKMAVLSIPTTKSQQLSGINTSHLQSVRHGHSQYSNVTTDFCMLLFFVPHIPANFSASILLLCDTGFWTSFRQEQDIQVPI